jgi:hypothetical protein
MTKTFQIKRGDTSPSLRFVLDPATTDLTGAAVRFQMRQRGAALVIDAIAFIVTPSGTPTVQYDWMAADTAIAGSFEAEFRVTYADGSVETFPNAGFLTVRIAEDVR